MGRGGQGWETSLGKVLWNSVLHLMWPWRRIEIQCQFDTQNPVFSRDAFATNPGGISSLWYMVIN